MPSPIRKIHHAQITVAASDLEAARSFYCGVMGLREIEKPESLQGRGGFWLAVGEYGKNELHIGVEEGVNRSATKAHLAYLVENLPEWEAHLIDAGIKPIESIPIPGYRRFEFRDPFGNRVELIEHDLI
jgi:catechol 2,3-dioxygenase-like lactoylglutathione lyase family enzyme